MNIEQEISMLPIQLIEAILRHDFFTAANVKQRKKEIENWINMNSNILGRRLIK